MATADKLTTVAQNVPKVYNAGLASLVNAMTNGGTNFSGMFAYFTEAYIYDEETSDSDTLYINRPKITTIPLIDTSKGTDFTYMFAYCVMLTTIPQLNTSNGKDFSYMFNACENLTTIPKLNASNGTNFNGMFSGCTNLTTIPQLDTSKGTSFGSMFDSCTSLTTIPQLDTSNGTNFYGMFYGCTNLTTIPQLNTFKGTNFDNMFGSSTTNSCTSLTTISFVKNCISANISFRYCDVLSHDSLISILNGLKTVTSRKVCTIGATNLAKLTDEEKAIATQKNWTLTS